MRKIQNLAVAAIAFAATVASSSALADTTIDTIEVIGTRPVLCSGMDCQWYLDNLNTYTIELNFDETAGGGGGPREPSQVAHVIDPNNTCGTMEELRAAAANKLAVNFVRTARKGDTIRITLADGKSDHWEYITGGSIPMTGTVINASPKTTDCD